MVKASEMPLTLRGLHYRLVSDLSVTALGYENRAYCYQRLSDLTARGRRAGTFPDLVDLTRAIELSPSWTGPSSALADLAEQYRRVRTEGQAYSIVIAVEKRTLVSTLRGAFDAFGVPIVAAAGFVSQTLADRLRRRVEADGRPGVLILASDFDPSGEDIARDFEARTDCWERVERVALTDEQVATLGLPESIGKTADSRAREFARRHGRLVQVELEALAPAQLVALYQQALDALWDTTQFEAVLEHEQGERERLTGLAENFEE